MLGSSYFDLAQRIYRATNFNDLADLLVAKLPALIGANEVVVVERSPVLGMCGVWNHGPYATRLRERMDIVNKLHHEHPIHRKVDFKSEGELGFAMSDHLSEEEYVDSRFVREVFDGLPVHDVLVGLLLSGHCRQAFVNCYIAEGHFNAQARECFDAILLTVRGVLDRLEARNVEVRVRERLLVMRADSPLALFVLNQAGEVLPMNHAAVKLSEAWWSKDDAFRQLSEEEMVLVEHQAARAWDNPVLSRWTDIEIDLGGGVMPIHFLPKVNCEGILMFSTGTEADAAEALRGILTRRQLEIMDWISEGKTSAEVAIILEISPRTVEKHLEAVFQRLSVENRIAAVRRYLDLKAGHPL